MSVQNCYLDRSTISTTVDDLNRGTYKLRYRVTTAGAQGPISVANQALSAGPNMLPSIWFTYSCRGDTDLHSYAREYKIEQDEKSQFVYWIEVYYKPLEPGEVKGDDLFGDTTLAGTPINSEANPVDRPTVVWWDREVYTSKDDLTIEGKLLGNAALTTYEDAEETEETRGVLVVEKNYLTLAEVIDVSAKFERAVNQTTWNVGGKSYPARTFICRSVDSSPAKHDNGYTYYTVRFRFACADYGRTWDSKYAERGVTYWKKDSSGDYVLNADGSRKRFTAPGGEPVLLKADGTLLEAGQDPVVASFRVKREVDFNNLPL